MSTNHLTVLELIEKLKTMPEDVVVWLDQNYGFVAVTDVKLDEDGEVHVA